MVRAIIDSTGSVAEYVKSFTTKVPLARLKDLSNGPSLVVSFGITATPNPSPSPKSNRPFAGGLGVYGFAWRRRYNRAVWPL